MQTLVKGLKRPSSEQDIKVKKTIQPVKKGDPANIEAQKGEVVVGNWMHDGLPEMYVIGGLPHSQGGTDLNVPDNSFIFSKEKSLAVKGEDILKKFGKKDKASGYDPAELAKQYDINKYRKILAEPNSDRIQRETAERMIKNYNNKLGALALTQESMKGFPDGIPFVSTAYLTDMGIDPATLVHGSGKDEVEVPTQSEENDNPVAKMGGSFKIKITGVPEFQKGGPKKEDPKPKQEFAYNPAFLEQFAKLLGEGNLKGALPADMGENRGMVDSKQHAVGKGVYGRKDWTKPEVFADFKNRNAWYFKDHPNFDPANKKDVASFQEEYNKKAESMGLSPYFDKKTGSKYSLDGKFGEVTYSVPNLDFKAPAAPAVGAPEKPAEQTVLPDLKKPEITPKVASTDNPFWTQDLIKMAGAAGDYARIKKYMPWKAGYETVLPNAVYADPNRELAANSEQANIAEMNLGAFAGPQALSSRMSDVQGKALSNAADILNRYNNLNVGVANNLENTRTGIINADSQRRSDRTTELYDQSVIANQQFDNAKNQAREKMRESFIQAWTNRGKTQGLNSINKQYRVDPRTGYVEFTGVPGVIDPEKQHQDILDYYNTIMKDPNIQKNPGHAQVLLNMYAKGLGVQPESPIPYEQYQ